MIILYIFTLVCFMISFIADKKKTQRSLSIALKKFQKILPAFLTMLVLISIILYLVPQSLILKYLGTENKYFGTLLATFLGSITLMPGFIAFPLAGILRQQGVPFMVLSAFSTSLMLVGILTIPIEKPYFGLKVTLVRNLICLIIAIVVAIITGIVFRELL